VMGTRTGLPVLHRAPPHHLEPGSAYLLFMINFKKFWQLFMH